MWSRRSIFRVDIVATHIPEDVDRVSKRHERCSIRNSGGFEVPGARSARFCPERRARSRLVDTLTVGREDEGPLSAVPKIPRVVGVIIKTAHCTVISAVPLPDQHGAWMPVVLDVDGLTKSPRTDLSVP